MIGFSIQSPVFLGNLSNQSNHDLIGNCENVDQFLAILKENDVRSIEIRILPRHADHEAYTNLIQKIWNAGLQITIHGHVDGEMEGSRFEDVYPSMLTILRHFDRYQPKLMMAIHAFDAKEGSEADLLRRTVHLFRQWTAMVESEKLPLHFALENNRQKSSKVDPGDTTSGVLKMVEFIDSPHMGITWDMGHYYSDLIKPTHNNLLEQPSMALPTPFFLERVIHTHIHGIVNLRTHHPLTTMESLPLEFYVKTLQALNYQGVYNLELTLPKFGSDRTIQEHVCASIQRLRSAVQPSRSHA